MKYIVIDSNIYRDIFSPSEKFSEEIKDSLIKLVEKGTAKLLLPLQIKQEVERNHLAEWYDIAFGEMNQKISKREGEISDVSKRFEKYKSHKLLIKEIQKDKKELEKIVGALRVRYKSKKSRSNQILKEIFSKAELLPESEEVLKKAELRVLKRNPPRDSEGHFGDAIIWESLIEFFKKRSMERDDTLVLVSNDKTAWGNDDKINLWLDDEWRKETKAKIILVQKFSDIPGLTKKESQKIKTEETSSSENFVSDFVNSYSWDNAGNNAQKLLKIKDKLTGNDYEKIIRASLENHQIYGSFFTPIPLRELVSNGPDFATKLVDNIDDTLWNLFCLKYGINLTRIKELPF